MASDETAITCVPLFFQILFCLRSQDWLALQEWELHSQWVNAGTHRAIEEPPSSARAMSRGVRPIASQLIVSTTRAKLSPTQCSTMSRAIPSTMKQSPLEDIVYRRDSELRKRAVLSLTFHFRAWTVLNCRNSSRSNTATPVWGFASAERLLRPTVAGSGLRTTILAEQVFISLLAVSSDAGRLDARSNC
jgi:hypothetical protein